MGSNPIAKNSNLLPKPPKFGINRKFMGFGLRLGIRCERGPIQTSFFAFCFIFQIFIHMEFFSSII